MQRAFRRFISISMRAVQVETFGGPEVLQVKDKILPAPEAGQVLVNIHAAGVNPVDTYIRTGTHAIKPSLPWTPGADGAGVVAAVGSDVKNLAVGDRVYTCGTVTGTYAEQAIVDATRVLPLPDNVTFEQGACIFTPCFTAHRALFHVGKVQKGESVLIHGASGGVGLAAVQIAVAAGLTVYGTASSQKGRDEIKSLGATAVFDHSKDGYMDEIKAATNSGEGFDVIVEMLANVNLGRDLPLLKAFGRVCIVGNRGTVEINPRDLMGREASIHGVMLGKVTAAQIQEAHALMYEQMKKGELKLVVGRELKLDDVAEAHVDVMAHSGGSYGNIVLKCQE